jgi:hypothetical protein
MFVSLFTYFTVKAQFAILISFPSLGGAAREHKGLDPITSPISGPD